MKFSELWLREFVNTKLNIEQLCSQINTIGFEVSSIKLAESSFKGIIVGEIVDCKLHQKINKLYLLTVKIGNKIFLNISCSASNCRKGIKVAVLNTKSLLPSNLQKKTIKLKNELLFKGKLCSYGDLGIYENQSEIIELPSDAVIGKDVCEYLKLDNNRIIEISINPNRADCLSIIGLAREIAVINKIQLNMPKIISVMATTNDLLPIQIKEPKFCPRYIGRIIKDINAKMITPLWMQEKLRCCGIQSINVVIDIANYVLLELGQPIQIFDKDCIEGGIIVRMAKNDEIIQDSDKNKIHLSSDVLVVSDYKKVISIAGVLVGENIIVNEKTKNLYLESAFFSPLTIIKSFSFLHHKNLRTEFSFRYERGVDTSLQYIAMERATKFLIDICGGKAGPIVDCTSQSHLPKRSAIKLRRSKLDNFIGFYINDAEISNALYYLGFEVTEAKNFWKIIAPSWRFDISSEEDIIEEIIRIYGYNNIPNKPIQEDMKIGDIFETTLSLKRAKTLLSDKGYQEVITYSFVNPTSQKLIYPDKKPLIIPSPVSSEMSVMRLSLLTGLLETVIYNQNRKQSRIRIFESGICFIPDSQANLGVNQSFMLAGVISGNRYEEHWDFSKNIVDFYDMKGDLESLLDLTGQLPKIQFLAKKIPLLHPGQSASIYLENNFIGFIGVIHPALKNKLDLHGRTVVFELEWKKIENRIIPDTKEVSRFPINRRDIAVVVSQKVPAAEILSECKRISTNEVEVDVILFDVYFGKGVEKGYKSLAIGLLFQSISRTLEDTEISNILKKCIKSLKMRFNASLRN